MVSYVKQAFDGVLKDGAGSFIFDEGNSVLDWYEQLYLMPVERIADNDIYAWIRNNKKFIQAVETVESGQSIMKIMTFM